MRSRWFYPLLAAFGLLLFALQAWIAGLPFAEAELTALTTFQEKQFELFRELNSLLITLATAAIGAIGAFVLDREKAGKLPSTQKLRALVSVVLATLSIFCGYLAHETLSWMLANKIFNLANPRILWSERFQTWMFIASIVLLADFFLLAVRRTEDPPHKLASRIKPHAPVVLACLALLTSSHASAQARQDKSITVYENLNISANVSAVITRWQEASRVRIEEAAQRAITEGFGANKRVLTQAYAKNDLKPQQASELTDALVEHYLYDLRDMKIATAKRLGGTPAAHFLAPQAGFTPRSIVIVLSDVELYPPKFFIENIRRLLDSRVGYIKVLSDPDEAHVAIDGQRKDQLTCRKFVASLGTHTVDVTKPSTNVNCSEKVTVEAGKDQLVPCPKGTIMRCKVP